jgi:hypothetical protein
MMRSVFLRLTELGEGVAVINLAARGRVADRRAQMMVRFACRAAGRDLTSGERHDLLPSRAYQPVCAA